MHWLTKILAVFAAVLSILLAALSIAYSANADRITSQFQSERLAKEEMRTQLQAERAAQAGRESSLQGQIDDLEVQSREMRRDKELLQREQGRLLAEAKTAEAATLAIQSRIDQLAATGQTQASLIETMYDEVARLRQNELTFAQREVQLADRVNDLSAQLEVAMESNRALQERLADLRRQLDTGTAVASSGRDARDRVHSPVTARVTNVRRDPASGAIMAQIDAGTSDRIEPGMELTISRENRFVAKLVVETADLNVASGRIDTLNRGGDVRRGDLVTFIR
ncbi:MAG: hypothetical protein EA376_11600 [Phycisphaeraceae bacterium]|nr:MAG: hypothetical protein EA376_11600 [Phycisphaeraceae bacterium]